MNANLYHIRRQPVIVGFIVDFYCHSGSLVIEIDGSLHDEQEQKENDIKQEKALKEMESRIFRFRNEDVVEYLHAVLSRIRELLTG